MKMSSKANLALTHSLALTFALSLASNHAFASSCPQILAQHTNGTSIFADRTPLDFINLPEIDLPQETHQSPFLAASSKSETALKFYKEKSQKMAKDFLLALEDGTATKLARLSETGDEFYKIHSDLSGIILGTTFDSKFLIYALQANDILYAFDGELVRYRPGQSSIFVLPRKLQRIIARNVYGVTMKQIRRSWVDSHFTPRFPQYKALTKLLVTENSSWFVSQNGYQIQIQKKVGSGFLNLQIEFRDHETLVFMKARSEGTDQLSSKQEKRVQDFIAKSAVDSSNTSLQALAQSSQKSELLAISSGEPTISFLQKLLTHKGFED